MKISKQRLKQIIKEEIEDAKQETTPEEDVQALGDFSEKLLQILKKPRDLY